MNFEHLRDQFQITGLSHDQSRGERVEESLLKQGFNVSTTISEESFVSKFMSSPAHIAVIDLLHIEWKLKDLIEKVLECAPETLFVFLGSADLFPRVQGYKDFGLYHFVVDDAQLEEYLAWNLDLAIGSLYSRMQNEKLLGELEGGPRKESASMSDAQWRLLLAAKDAPELFQVIHGLFPKCKIMHFKYVASRYSLVLHSALGFDQESVKGVGLELTAGQAQNYRGYLADLSNQGEFRKLMASVFKASRFDCLVLNIEQNIDGVLVYAGIDKKILPELNRLVSPLYEKLVLSELMNEQSVNESVTGLLKEKYYRQSLADEISRSRRVKLPLCVLHISVDCYHIYTNKFGHEHAEFLMASLAGLVKKTSRTNDLCARTAPDEIKVLLPHTHLKGAGVRAERLRRIVMQSSFALSEGIAVSISVGVSEYPSTCRDAEGLEASAQKAVKQVIQQGGNKVCLAAVPSGFRPDFVVESESEAAT